MAEVINEFPCISSRMKLQAVIGGDKIDEMDYRFFLFYKAIELGCERFFSCIRNSEGSQGLLVRIEGNDDQVSDFKDFIADQVHEGAKLSCIIFEEYTGHVPTIETFLAFCTVELLDRWNREYKSAEKDDHNLIIL
ncbi:MAG: hypothetical protein ACYDHX_02980 [Methanothrix sp.]